MSTLPHPTPPAESMPAWEQYLEKNFKVLLLVCGAAVLAVAAYGGIKFAGHRKAVAAGEAFAAAKTIEDCDIVVQQFPGTIAAGNALLMKADLLWEQNKKDSSLAVLREFTTKHADHPLFAHGLLAFGSKLEALGERSEAKTVFERLINEFATSDLAPLAQLRLGDLLWAEGKEAAAKEAYESVAAKFPDADNAFTSQSETRTRWIAAKLPTIEVDGPPKPKEPATPPPGAPQINIPGLAPIPMPTPTLPKPATATSAPVAAPTPATGTPPSSPPKPAPAPTTAAPAPAAKPAPAPSTPAPAPAATPTPSAPASAEPAKPLPPASAAPAPTTAKPAEPATSAPAPKAP